MPTLIDVNSPLQNLDKLLQNATPELEAFDSARHVRRIVSRARVLELSNTLLTSWATLAVPLDEELSPKRAAQRQAELAGLDARAWTFYAADLASEELFANTTLKQRRALAKAVTEHDRFLFKWAMPLFGDHVEHGETLRDISRGTGARDDAEDVLRLVSLFRDNWNQAASQQQSVTEAYLDQAAADATRQLDLLRNGVVNPARKLADAAYSLWHIDYEELMQLGRYFCRREDDVLLRFPGVRELPTRPSEGGEVEDENANAVAAAVEATPPADASPVAD